MRSNPFKIAAQAGLVLVIIFLLVQNRQLSALVKQKNSDLSLQANRLAALERVRVEFEATRKDRIDQDELERLRKEHSELLRLRGEVGLLRQREATLAKQLEAATQAGSVTATSPKQPPDLPVGTVPRAQWADVGTAEPSTSLQSAMWAIREERLDRLRDLGIVSPDLDFDTVAKDFQRVFNASVGFKQKKRTEFLAPDKAAVSVEVFMNDGRTEKGLMHFRKVNGAWLLKLD